MNAKRIAKVLIRAKESLRNAYWTMDIVGEELQELEDQGRFNELWQIQCICNCLEEQLNAIVERYNDLPF